MTIKSDTFILLVVIESNELIISKTPDLQIIWKAITWYIYIRGTIILMQYFIILSVVQRCPSRYVGEGAGFR